MGCRCEDLHSWILMLHLKEDSLTREIISRMSMFQEPEEIFPLVFSLKEEGNKLVKTGNFEQAFTIYSKAVIFLVLGLPCCDQGSHPFRDLVIPLNLNLAMCALKLFKFQWKKCLCDCVLRYEPTNVKAFFRRALASLRLGQLEDAKNDLTIAKKVEPNNGDVLKEWNKVNLLSPNPPRKDIGSSSYADMEVDSKLVASDTSLGVENSGFNPLKLPTKNHSDLVNETRAESIVSNLNETRINNLVGSKVNLSNDFMDPPRVYRESEDSDANSRSSRPFLKTNLGKPKWFSNRSRPGSILNLSPPNYKRLVVGQVLRYQDQHLIGFISVRVKRFTGNLDYTTKRQEVESPSATFLEKKVTVDDSIIRIPPIQDVSVVVNDITSVLMDDQ